MGAFLDKPKTEIHKTYNEHNDLRIAYSCMQGWRIEMEDAHVIELSLPDKLSSWSFFGVFDGHAGNVAAIQASKLLLTQILETEEFKDLKSKTDNHQDQKFIADGIKKGFISFDEKLAELKDKSGCTAIVSFITPTDVIFGNCGDSRALLVSNDQPVLDSLDHKPTNEIEKKRIQDAGLQIVMSRVNGALAVSRSFGDFDYKRKDGLKPEEQAVSPEPDIYFYSRNKAEDQFLVIACDGIWDVYSNELLAKYVLHRFKCVEDLTEITSEILQTSLSKGSKDNMSVMVIAFPGAPKIDSSLLGSEQSLNSKIKDEVKYLAKDELLTFPDVYSQIEEKQFSDYPPGGIIAKRHYMEEQYNILFPHEETSNNN